MNKKTKIITDEKYLHLVATIRNGYIHNGVTIKQNHCVAAIIVFIRNTGIKINEIRNIEFDDFKKNIYGYTLYDKYFISNELYKFVYEYIKNNSISRTQKMFDMSERNMQKYIQKACEYLGYEKIGIKSLHKLFEQKITMQGLKYEDLKHASNFIEEIKTE